jgi:hypothetical protein
MNPLFRRALKHHLGARLRAKKEALRFAASVSFSAEIFTLAFDHCQREFSEIFDTHHPIPSVLQIPFTYTFKRFYSPRNRCPEYSRGSVYPESVTREVKIARPKEANLNVRSFALAECEEYGLWDQGLRRSEDVINL